MDISVVILLERQKHYLEVCLQSYTGCPVVADNPESSVVDNASTDGSPEWWRNCFDVKIIRNVEGETFPKRIMWASSEGGGMFI